MFTVDNHVKVIARVQVFTLYKVCLIVNEHKFHYFSFQLTCFKGLRLESVFFNINDEKIIAQLSFSTTVRIKCIHATVIQTIEMKVFK